MTTLTQLYNNIKTFVLQAFESKEEEDINLPIAVERMFHYTNGRMSINSFELEVTGSSFSTFSSTPFTYNGRVFVDWGDDTGLIEYTGGKLTHTYSSSDDYIVKIYGYITSLETNCFNSCSNLISITIPSSVTSLGPACFIGCTGLTSITIPSSVTSLETSCFESCTGLTSIEIPNSVTTFGSYCFRYCTGLTSISIPNSVTSLGISCFESCTGLTSIEIPNRVTTFGSYCFRYCTGLTSISIPNSVTSLGTSCFRYCTNLTSIILNWTTNDEILTYNQNWITNASSNLLFHIPSGTTSLYTAKEYPLEKLEEELSDNIIELRITGDSFSTYSSTPFTYNSRVFVDWGDDTDLIEYTSGKLTHTYSSSDDYTVKIYGDITILKNSCFYGCTGLTSITLPDSVTSLGASCFAYCTGLTSITLPDSVTTLWTSCFYDCTGLTSIEIPNSVTTLENSCFRDCTGLTSIILNWDTSTEIITYDSTWIMDTSSNLLFHIPNGTSSLYTAKGYPSDKLLEVDD